jgi:hypothetical protein
MVAADILTDATASDCLTLRLVPLWNRNRDACHGCGT